MSECIHKKGKLLKLGQDYVEILCEECDSVVKFNGLSVVDYQETTSEMLPITRIKITHRYV